MYLNSCECLFEKCLREDVCSPNVCFQCTSVWVNAQFSVWVNTQCESLSARFFSLVSTILKNMIRSSMETRLLNPKCYPDRRYAEDLRNILAYISDNSLEFDCLHRESVVWCERKNYFLLFRDSSFFSHAMVYQSSSLFSHDMVLQYSCILHSSYDMYCCIIQSWYDIPVYSYILQSYYGSLVTVWYISVRAFFSHCIIFYSWYDVAVFLQSSASVWFFSQGVIYQCSCIIFS